MQLHAADDGFQDLNCDWSQIWSVSGSELTPGRLHAGFLAAAPQFGG